MPERSKTTCCFISESEQLRAANKDAVTHLNSCHLGCGIRYEPGLCKMADALFEAAESTAKAFPGESCGKPAQWTIAVDGGSYEDYTLSCTDHVGHMLTDAPAHTVCPIEPQDWIVR
jgi:hypothetical protein